MNQIGESALSRQPQYLWRFAAVALAILAVHALLLHFMGRIPWCTCGFAIWTSHAWSSDTSQDLLDPYSFTHVLHGLILYWFFHLAAKKWNLGYRFIAVMLVETGWELLENSPPVIRHYRAATASLDYTGDSILNSLGDVMSCMLGFLLASWLSVWASVLLLIGVEVGLLITIRDNLTLNVLMLLHPINPIKHWQLHR